ncbi:hypothetical protein [Sinomicrobium sp. M5D2P9]
MLFTIALYPQDPSNRAQPANRFTEDLRVIEYAQQVIRKIDPSRHNRTTATKITGSAYLDENFAPGIIYYRDKALGEHMLRYNIYAEEFELKKEDTIHAVAAASDIEIVLNKRKFIFKYYKNRDVKEFGYFEVVSKNEKCTLLKKYRKVLTESKPAVTSFDVDVPARFVDLEDFFVLFGDEEIVEIKSKNNYVIKLFKARGADIKLYIRENNLNVKESEDLINVIEYCNSLLQL